MTNNNASNINGGLIKLLKPEQVAEILGVNKQTLAVWRCTKRYPLPYTKSGRLIRYRYDDVMMFIDRNWRGA